ncbi:MAG TPA: MarR family transcriptional regulator [Beijerinckiaceae bacterium]|nr:MarR family transcriptional regulator [Beijerinckiaceae bacterium]
MPEKTGQRPHSAADTPLGSFDDVEAIVRLEPRDQKRELRLWLRLLTCANLIESEIRQRLRIDYDMTLPRFDLMAQLYREPDGLRLSDLSKRMMVSNGNLTALVDRLIADGYVSRTTDTNDRRAAVVQLTKAGTLIFSQLAEAHEGWLRALMGDLSPVQIQSLTQDLAQLKRSLIHRRQD